MSEKIHNWDPFSVQEICELLSGLTIKWGIGGGYAIELFVGKGLVIAKPKNTIPGRSSMDTSTQ